MRRRSFLKALGALVVAGPAIAKLPVPAPATGGVVEGPGPILADNALVIPRLGAVRVSQELLQDTYVDIEGEIRRQMERAKIVDTYRELGVECCSFCLGLSGAHTVACYERTAWLQAHPFEDDDE